MGADYFDCDECGTTICDCGEFYVCLCGKYFCPECHENLLKNGFLQLESSPHSEEEVFRKEFESCWYCTEKRNLRKVTNDEFLTWLIEITGKTQDDYLNHLRDKGDLE